jgi:hypothetical protein
LGNDPIEVLPHVYHGIEASVHLGSQRYRKDDIAGRGLAIESPPQNQGDRAEIANDECSCTGDAQEKRPQLSADHVVDHGFAHLRMPSANLISEAKEADLFGSFRQDGAFVEVAYQQMSFDISFLCPSIDFVGACAQEEGR